MRRITALLASSVLLVAACGGDDDSAGGVQSDAAEELIRQADDANLDPDESCIRDKAAGLSDEDAQKIVDTGSSDTPELSPEGMTIMADAMSCVSGQAMLDSIIEGLPEGVDGDCVRDKLKDADFGAIFESGTMPPELEQAVTDCGTG
jgi:hypothetical protein